MNLEQFEIYIRLFHHIAALWMCSLIWVIQLVHYPTFHFVDKEIFAKFEKFHTANITPITAPFMLVELTTGAALVFLNKDSITYWTLLMLTLGNFAVTAFLSVPCHSKLSSGYSKSIVDKLVKTNWFRTAFWTLRAIIVAQLLL